MESPVVPYALTAAAVTFAAWGLLVKKRSSSLPLPPGPKRQLFIGNMFDIPTEYQWLTFHSWCQQYGDVVYVETPGQKMVILDSLEAITEIMEKRSANYSDRPEYLINDLMDLNWVLSRMGYGDRWRAGRRMIHQHINSGAISKYSHLQLHAARTFAVQLMQNPSHLAERIRVSVGGSVMKLVYGIDIKGTDDPYIAAADQLITFMRLTQFPGRYWVEWLWPLKFVPSWFPGAGFQKDIKAVKETNNITRDNPINFVKERMAAGTASPSITQAMYEGLDPGDTEREKLIADVTGVAYIAGMDTSVAVLYGFFLALLVYPEVQARGQAEIDAVVGTDRLPTFEDRANLPYVNAIVSEALRWIPVTPIALPHYTKRDDEYKGYLIPKGSIVVGNAWAILHDPAAYPNPDAFQPERFLRTDENGSVVYDTSVRDPRVACFGFGRRICPGQWLADRALFATIATCLATLTVNPVKDAAGIPQVPKVEVTPFSLSRPKPYDYDIKPRSRRAEELVANALA